MAFRSSAGCTNIIEAAFFGPTFPIHPGNARHVTQTSVGGGAAVALLSAPFATVMKMSELIYLDNNATTRVDPAVVEEMLPYLTELYGNPSSGYRFGQQVGKALEKARERVAALLGCEPGEILFTSCGTESTNAAINSGL